MAHPGAEAIVEGGVTPLVLLPGTLCDERVFAPLLRQMPEVDGVVLPTHTAGTMRELAEGVLAAAPETFALLGFSFGGFVALEVALLAPERVRGLALLGTTAAPVPPENHEARRQGLETAQQLGLCGYVREHLWPAYVGTPARDDSELLSLLAAMADAVGQDAYRRQTEAALARRDYRPSLQRMTVPVLLVAGEHDSFCPPDMQREFAAAFPDGSSRCIGGAGHFALVEKADEVAAHVAAWFQTVRSRVAPAEARPATSKEND